MKALVLSDQLLDQILSNDLLEILSTRALVREEGEFFLVSGSQVRAVAFLEASEALRDGRYSTYIVSWIPEAAQLTLPSLPPYSIVEVKQVEEQEKPLELEAFLADPDTALDLTDKQLLDVDDKLHELWKTAKGPDAESVFNAHSFLVQEMKKRGIEHESRDDGLDPATFKEELPPPEWIEERMKQARPFLIVPGYLSLVGSATRDLDSAHDIDIVVRDRFSRLPGSWWDSIFLAVRKLLDPEKQKKIHMLPAAEGPHSDSQIGYVELFDLVLVPRKQLSRTLVAAEAATEEKPVALILVAPHAELLWLGEKQLVVESKKFISHIGEPVLLTQSGMAYGQVKLGESEPISWEELMEQHLIKEEEWPDKPQLYAYKITWLQKFDEPVPVDIPRGAQNFVIDWQWRGEHPELKLEETSYDAEATELLEKPS